MEYKPHQYNCAFLILYSICTSFVLSSYLLRCFHYCIEAKKEQI
nr:MAG TPA: hypothetical protein [Caudoviricetes sp.]